jgi:RNA polymerase sigma-B factor
MVIILDKEKKIQISNKDELLEKYQYLVVKIANNFDNTTQSRENLEEVGYIGLLNAVNLYDQDVHKINFKEYAQILITKEMHQYLTNRDHKVDRPDWLSKLNYKVEQFISNYRQLHQRFPHVSEIANHININSSGVQEILKSRNSVKEKYPVHHLSDDMSKIQPDIEKIRSQSYQSFKIPIEDVIALKKALKKIKQLQESVVYYLFVMDLSQTKVAKMLGISKQKVEQMKKEAFQNLKS